ncbi:tyrosine-type recombinase/integrase [Corynebacterium epidermidicanis]|uniref:Integrase n=1 Tax=Corynebacterium epidermidicanis TaxID=1050174 RepID=A0A0G3GR67_9CORY|nr:tyrosine-type recombinase/integrase [Corynebacterium epidermidicanis]AKK03080.1 Integrase [Corynebacterium epidermidicanis]
MARPKLAIGEVGEITTKRIGHRNWVARARVGTIAGRSIQISKSGVTARDARQNLEKKARKVAYMGGDAPITGKSTLEELVTVTLDKMEQSGTKRPQTIRGYRKAIATIQGTHGDRKISNLQLHECQSAILCNWIEDVAKRAPSAARNCKVVLKASFEHAMKLGIDLWQVNPVEAATLPSRPAESAVELSDETLKGIRESVAAWQTDRKLMPLSLMVELLIGTGMRPGEILALKWEDVDLEATPATLVVAGTVIEDEGRTSVRQDLPKTERGFRRLMLPSWLVVQLEEWRGLATSEKIFPSRAGTWYSLANVRRAFREALEGTAYEGWQLKGFRSGVATRIARELGPEEAARQLGHTSPVVTDRHYIAKWHEAGDYTATFDRMAPISKRAVNVKSE